jgi:hypothetical protein
MTLAAFWHGCCTKTGVRTYNTYNEGKTTESQ